MRTLLVDGTNDFVRSYSVNTTLSANGEPCGGVSGTLKSLRSMVRKLKPDRVIFVWDGPGGSVARRKLFREYKKGRRPRYIVGRNYVFKDVDEARKNKLWQVQILQEILTSLPVCQIIAENIEADDVIGYLVTHSKFFGHKSNIIATCDKDFNQLISDDTVVYNPIKKALIAPDDLVSDTGVHPNNWLFYRTISGDPSDNIKGVKGVGIKTVQKYFDVEKSTPLTVEMLKSKCEIIDEIKDKTEKKTFQKLSESIDIIERNWTLMSLTEALISISIKDKLTSKIVNFNPSLDRQKFYVNLMKLGIGISPITFTNDFNRLLFSNK